MKVSSLSCVFCWICKIIIIEGTCLLSILQGQLRGRTEIAPDQREKFLQKYQQVQQGHSTLLNMPSLVGGNHKQFSAQQQNPLLQQVLLVYQICLLFAYWFFIGSLLEDSLWSNKIELSSLNMHFMHVLLILSFDPLDNIPS